MKYSPGKVWKLALHIVLGGFMFCYTLGVFNTCSDNVSASLNWGDMKSTFVTVFSTIVPVGVLIGSMVAGKMMNYYGRRKSMMMTDILMMISSGITVVPFTPTFAIGRFLSGIAAGIFMTIPVSFVNEVTPDEMIPKIGPLVQISTNVGLIFAYGFGLPLPTGDYDSNSFNWWWVFMFLFPGFVALYQFCYFLFVCKHDSALWLIRKGKTEETMKSLLMVYTEEGVNDGLERFSPKLIEGSAEQSESNKEVSLKQIFTEPKYRKMLRIGILLGIIQQVSGINAGIFYSTSIFSKLGGGLFISRLFTFITGFVFMVASIASIPLLSKYGRKTLLISGQILLALDLCALGIMTSIPNSPMVLQIIGVMLIFVFFSYSLGATLWLYLGEAMIEQILGISAAANSTFVCIVTGVFPITVEYLGINYAFFFFGACMILGTVYCYFDLVETKGKTKPEIMNRMLHLE